MWTCHTHIYIYICARTHTHTHTHTYIYIKRTNNEECLKSYWCMQKNDYSVQSVGSRTVEYTDCISAEW